MLFDHFMNIILEEIMRLFFKINKSNKLNYFLFVLMFFFEVPIFSFSGMKKDEKDKAIILEEFIFDKAPFPSCHASTIAETPEGIVAAWFGGTHEKNKDVEIYLSRKINGKWTTPKSVASGIQKNGERYPCWNPVLFQVPSGKLILFYKVGPDPSEWWGMMKTSVDNGKSWSDAVKLPDGILGPIKDKPVLLNNGALISSSSTENDGWRVHFEISKDTGKTWEVVGPINNPEKYNLIQPSILTYNDSAIQALFRSKLNGIVTSWSKDNGETWSPPEPTGLPNPNSGIDAVTLNNGLQLLVFNNSEITEGRWGGPRTPLNVAVSKDGKHWKEVLTLEDTEGEYSYPAVIQTKDGMVHITYTWKREKIKHVVIDPANL
jgi:predicted neuraminidase